MHELSIVQSLIEIVARHVPAGGKVQRVTVRAGVLRAIDPDAMQMAWNVIRNDSCCKAAKLEMEMLKWQMACPSCCRKWESDDAFIACSCGNPSPQAHGTDELDLRGIEIDTAD